MSALKDFDGIALVLARMVMVFFVFIFFSICGTTRLISWIAKGFKRDSFNGG